MKIRLDTIGDEPFEWVETLEIALSELASNALDADGTTEEATDVALGGPRVGPVRCRGSIRRTESGLFLRAGLDYDQTLPCMRCLSPVVESVHTDLDLLLIVGDEEPSEEERELAEEDLGVLLLSEPWLETRPLVVEQVQIELPMKPLCREDCAGLCSSCGVDLNAETCDCAPPSVDPRWAVLAGLARDDT